MNVSRINVARLRTPAEINDALDSIKAEIRRLNELEAKVEARRGELMAAAVMAQMPDMLAGDGSFADLIAQMVADAQAYRELMADDGKEAAKEEASADVLDEEDEDEAEDGSKSGTGIDITDMFD